MHPEAIPFSAKEQFTRRDFVMSMLATGFAAAVAARKLCQMRNVANRGANVN